MIMDNEKKINKPITILINELKSKIINSCNESQLPPIILDLVIQGIYLEIHNLAEKQIADDEIAYMKAIKDGNVENFDSSLMGD